MKQFQKLIALSLILGCSSVIAFRGGAAHPPNKLRSAAQSQKLKDSYLDEKLAQFYEVYNSVYSFEDRIMQLEKANGGRKPNEIEIVKDTETGGYLVGTPDSQQMANKSALLQMQVANADLIIMGVPVKSRTLPIRNRSFLFTEYEVRVDRTITADQHYVIPGDAVIVSRGGGELVVDGVLVKAIEPAFTEFQLNKQYIFMLRAVPGTDTYRALGSGTFVVENGTVGTISPAEATRNPKRDLDSFLSELNEAVARKRSGRN